MVKPDRRRFITGMTGVYFTAAELSSRGYVVTVTARNAPGIDLMASTPNMKRTYNIEVKTNRAGGTQSFWLVGPNAKKNKSPRLIYVFVNLKKNNKPDFYVVKSSIVAKNIGENKTKKGTWYSFRLYGKDKDRWEILK